MDTASVSGTGGMASLAQGVIKDDTAGQLIAKTLEKVQAASPDAAAIQASAANAAGLGNKIDVRV